MAVRFVIIGGGPAGHTAASAAARLGAEVTLIERDVVGGAAHLWDCIPSKAMIATGGAMALARRAPVMGLAKLEAELDFDALKHRITAIEDRLNTSVCGLLSSQGVRIIRGTGRLVGPHCVEAEEAGGRRHELDADAVLLCTGSRPRVPEWCDIDGERVLSTRQAYPPPELPSHLVVIGSGVTGVEFVHMFSSFGCRVTLIVSRQQVLPGKDAEVAAGSLDAITLWHVLEHVDDPAAALRRLRGWLAPGGVLLAGVPNLASWQARLGGPRWYHLDLPRHRTHFTPAGIEALLERCGFEVLAVEHRLLEHNPFGLWQSLVSRLTPTPSWLY
ncbi:MAG: FAD-dependent oxidoreductase, partial [Actinobacteria bacterium]|nr:FAD-dependent oxidoreductase [Actinomycetota bacterium]